MADNGGSDDGSSLHRVRCSPTTTARPTTTGCAIAGGTFYNPAVQQFPASYVGKYFFADACSGWIRLLDPATKTAQLFMSGGDGLIDVKTGPDGSLYYLSRLDGTGNPGIVHKVTFSGKPAISTQPASITVAPGQPATFSVVATGSAPLSYQWQRDGINIAGAQSSSYTLASPTLTDNGAQFRVVVSNTLGSTTSASRHVDGDQQQVHRSGTILTPKVGTQYNAGAKITFTGSATDPEDGTLPASAFAWEIIFHHNTHTHLGPADRPGSHWGRQKWNLRHSQHGGDRHRCLLPDPFDRHRLGGTLDGIFRRRAAQHRHLDVCCHTDVARRRTADHPRRPATHDAVLREAAWSA